MWILVLLACSSVTGEDRMVGTIVLSDGAPLSDTSVQTVEARSRTDAEGHFEVEYKKPSTYVDFRVGSTQFQRHYREADRNTRVSIPLPPLRDITVSCDVPKPCTGLLQWDLPDGLIGRVVLKCDPGKVVSATRVPEGLPEATCQSDVTMPTEQIWYHDTGDTLILGGAAFTMKVEIRTPGLPADAAPDDCDVFVGPKSAVRGEQGWWSALATGKTVVTATCEGVPATPRHVQALPDREVSLHWTGSGPTLDLVPTFPGITDIVLRSEEGWDLPLSASAGAVLLPALRPGRYKVTGGVDPGISVGEWPDDLDPGTLRLASRGSGFVGFLILDEALDDGAVPVTGP